MAMPQPSNLTDTDAGLRVLVFAPFGKDSALIADTLRQSAIGVEIVADAAALASEIARGAGAAVLTEEALSPPVLNTVVGALASQPPWSDFPMVVLTAGGASTPMSEVAARSRAPLGTVTLLERPLRGTTLVSAVRSALRARQRQYEIRRSHEMLESQVQQRTAALRTLSARLLHIQDEERRRFARELHDSLGQCLTAAKISVSLLAQNLPENPTLKEAEDLLDRAIAETRTISHLLHPPLLDEMGFASAATWYVEGFGKRSGIQTNLNVSRDLPRLARESETALFRILQESLTNVHRHSGSHTVDVDLAVNDSTATLTVRDTGKGIPRNVLEGVRKGGAHVGVGLAGIRERVTELGGSLDVQSNGSGTILKATIPIAETRRNREKVASPHRASSSAS
jgi:signal transduction histidine kinase